MNAPAAAAPKPALVQRLKQQAFGLIEDFWKDTPAEFPPVFEMKLAGRALKIPNLLRPLPPGAAPEPAAPSTPSAAPHAAASAAPAASKGPWHALPGELAEKMWGEENILPAGDAVMDLLVKPLNLLKESTVLDLTAGLGGPLRHMAGQFATVKGLEENAAIAARAKELGAKLPKAKQVSIEPFDPANFSLPAIHNCIVARELFYRAPARDKLFYAAAAAIKGQGQIAFTDYIVDPESRGKPAIAAWQVHEKVAPPFSIIEMAEAWAKHGVKIRANEDQTAMYRREIVAGINRFVAALRIAPPPDAETKQAILHEVELWIYRLAALQQGMKFVCFYAAKS